MDKTTPSARSLTPSPDDVIAQAETLEVVPCGVCGGMDHQHLFTAKDYLYGNNGEWPVARCSDCGVVLMGPRIPPSRIGDYYPKSYYTNADAGAPTHNTRKRAEYEAVARRRGYTLQNAPQNAALRARLLLPILLRQKYPTRVPLYVANGRVLDVGCGNGETLDWYRYLGWDTYGVEVSSDSATYAQQAGHNVYIGELHEAGYPDAYFDAVTMWDTLEHIHNPADAMREVYRILKPGGRIYISVPNFGSFYGRLLKDKWFMFTAPVHYYHYNKETLTRLLTRCAFHNVEISFPLGDAGAVETLMTYTANGPFSVVKWLLTRRKMLPVCHTINYFAPRGHLHAEAVR